MKPGISHSDLAVFHICTICNMHMQTVQTLEVHIVCRVVIVCSFFVCLKDPLVLLCPSFFPICLKL